MEERRTLVNIKEGDIPASAIEVTTDNYENVSGNTLYIPLTFPLDNYVDPCILVKSADSSYAYLLEVGMFYCDGGAYYVDSNGSSTSKDVLYLGKKSINNDVTRYYFPRFCSIGKGYNFAFAGEFFKTKYSMSGGTAYTLEPESYQSSYYIKDDAQYYFRMKFSRPVCLKQSSDITADYVLYKYKFYLSNE